VQKPPADRRDEAPLDERIMRMSLNAYQTREQRVAMRGALSDAAHLCDALAKQIEASNPGRGKGKVSSLGRYSADVVRNCGNAIWAMREKVQVRDGD
jgi:hypothetical protein